MNLVSDSAIETPRAAIVSDYPIIAEACARWLRPAYAVRLTCWARADLGERPSLVVADLTGVPARAALSLLSALPGGTRLVVTSLDHNDVDVYTLDGRGLVREPSVPGLLALAL